jgi:hypothetical protein
MTGIDTARRDATLARLAASRAEIRRVLEPPPPRVSPGDVPDSGDLGFAAFPRSRTMKMLLSARGAGTLGAVACGLFVARPQLALRLLRMLPAGAIGRMLLVKAISALRSNPASQANSGSQANSASQAKRE